MDNSPPAALALLDPSWPLTRPIAWPIHHSIGVACVLNILSVAGKDFRRLWAATPQHAVDELFESDAVKALVLAPMAIPRGVGGDYPGGGIEVLKMVAGDEQPELAQGGSHSIAQVLQPAYVHNGGQIRAVHHVDKIFIDRQGRAVGVRLRDGRAWKARRAVVSNSDPRSTMIDMVGEEYLPRTFTERVKDIQCDEFSYFQGYLALKAPVDSPY